MIDWSLYSPFVPPVALPLDQLTRAQAQRQFDLLMSSRQERREQLEKLLAMWGERLDLSDSGLDTLNAWFLESVDSHPSDSARLANRWVAVGFDIGVAIGEEMIKRAPTLEWILLTEPASDINYHSAVVAGPGVPPLCPMDLVVGEGELKVAGGSPSMTYFRELMTYVVRQAAKR